MAFKVSSKTEGTTKHELDVTTLLFHEGILYSGADDGKIKAWSPDLKILAEATAHPCSVYCITVSPKVLYSCSNEGTIISWTLKDLKRVKTVHRGESEIWRVYYKEDILYSGDDQGVVRIFINDKLHCIVNIVEGVKDMAVDGKVLYTVRDLDVVLTQLRLDALGERGSFNTKCTIMGKCPLCLFDDKLCFASRNGRDIILHENRSGYQNICEVKDAHEMIINSICAYIKDSEISIYSAGWDKIVKEWKLINNKLELKNECNIGVSINVITVGDEGQVYVGGQDGYIYRIK